MKRDNAWQCVANAWQLPISLYIMSSFVSLGMYTSATGTVVVNCSECSTLFLASYDVAVGLIVAIASVRLLERGETGVVLEYSLF